MMPCPYTTRKTDCDRRLIQQALLKQSPSLKSYLPEALNEAYEDGLDLAVRETSLDYQDFPAECHYSLDRVLNADFLPESDKN